MESKLKLFNYWTDSQRITFSACINIYSDICSLSRSRKQRTRRSIVSNIFIIFILLTGVISVDIERKYRTKPIAFLISLIIFSVLADTFIESSVVHLHIIIRIIFLWLLVILIFKKYFCNRPISFFFRIAGSITIYLLVGFIWANMLFILYYFDIFYYFNLR